MVSKSATVLVGTGVFSLSLAGLTVAVAQPALFKASTVYSTTTDFVGTGSNIDADTGKLVNGAVTMKRSTGTHTHDVNGKKVAYGNSSTAVYDIYSDTSFTADGSTTAVNLSKTLQTYAFDRNTGKLQRGDYGDATVLAPNAYATKLPFGAKKTSYQYYDDNTATTATMTYVGEKTIDGLKTYEYTYSVPGTDMGVLPVVGAVPGAWVGETSPSVPAHQFVSVTEHLYFEPVTGSPVGADVDENVWAQVASGTKVDLVVVKGLHVTPASQAAVIKDAKASKAKVQLLQRAPWVLGVLGLLLLAGGLLRRRGQTPTGASSLASGALPTPRDEPVVEAKLR
ncbi:MAG: hypothetical protein JWM02_823 [Frankiales bacterium]|nr:hypothetical protein [Frankiales bacterium]